MKAVILTSGGLDSTVTAAVAKQEGFVLYLLTMAYGQRHHIETNKAQKLADWLAPAEHKVLSVDLSKFGGSALTSIKPVPKNRSEQELTHGIPITYVPARNTIFLSLALAYAETIDAKYIFIGANILDYSGYPDCRPEFLRAFETVARLGTRYGVEGTSIEIRAPLLYLKKEEIIQLGLALSVPFELTHSCYNPENGGLACGQCDSCLIRLKGFRKAGLNDPVPYFSHSKI